ncbi:hypothetical protein, partial [Cloacibacillus sp. An23]|uniref:hypothetical protein n=1 Tax=Cloacibacillus sp. An23 TaxID=1965591 RepID=UPI001951D3AA
TPLYKTRLNTLNNSQKHRLASPYYYNTFCKSQSRTGEKGTPFSPLFLLQCQSVLCGRHIAIKNYKKLKLSFFQR